MRRPEPLRDCVCSPDGASHLVLIEISVRRQIESAKRQVEQRLCVEQSRVLTAVVLVEGMQISVRSSVMDADRQPLVRPSRLSGASGGLPSPFPRALAAVAELSPAPAAAAVVAALQGLCCLLVGSRARVVFSLCMHVLCICIIYLYYILYNIYIILCFISYHIISYNIT